MTFPVFYQGSILFVDSKPAFDAKCCCGPPRNPPSRCCGSVIEMEYEVYDETDTVIVFSGMFTWNLEHRWTALPPEDEIIEVVETFRVTNGDYTLEESSIPNAYCFSLVGVPISVRISILLAAYKNGLLYQNPTLVINETCPLDNEFSDWVYTNSSRLRIRYT